MELYHNPELKFLFEFVHRFEWSLCPYFAGKFLDILGRTKHHLEHRRTLETDNWSSLFSNGTYAAYRLLLGCLWIPNSSNCSNRAHLRRDSHLWAETGAGFAGFCAAWNKTSEKHKRKLPKETQKSRQSQVCETGASQESQVCALPGFGDSLTGTFRVATEGEKEWMSKWQNQITHQIEFVKWYDVSTNCEYLQTKNKKYIHIHRHYTHRKHIFCGDWYKTKTWRNMYETGNKLLQHVMRKKNKYMSMCNMFVHFPRRFLQVKTMRRFRVPPEPRHWHATGLEKSYQRVSREFSAYTCVINIYKWHK